MRPPLPADILREASLEAYLTVVRQIVARGDHHVHGVMGDTTNPGWAYSVGLHTSGLPELIMIGALSVPDQVGVLRELADDMVSGGEPKPGERRGQILVGYELTFIEVDDTTTDRFALAHGMQSNFRALQVVWPDHGNRFPWEPGCEIPKGLQPLLGTPPPH